MKRGRTMRWQDFEQFHTTISMWLGLRICSVEELADRVGCRKQTIDRIRRKQGMTTYKLADEIMQAIGQIETKYVAKCKRERAMCGEGVRLVAIRNGNYFEWV